MSFDSSASLVFRRPDGEIKTEFQEALFGSIMAHGGTKISSIDSGEIFAIFPTAFAAVRSALDVQKSIANNAFNEEFEIQSAVDHLATVDPGHFLDDESRHNLLAFASSAEIGGVALSRTVYEDVRYRIKVEYDTRHDSKQIAFVCQEIRRKLNILNLDELSAVRISRKAIAKFGDPRPVFAISLVSRMFSRLMFGHRNIESNRSN